MVLCAGELRQWYVTFWWAVFWPMNRLRHCDGVGSYSILFLSCSVCLAIHTCWLLCVGLTVFMEVISNTVVGCTHVSTSTPSKLQWTLTASSTLPPLGSNQKSPDCTSGKHIWISLHDFAGTRDFHRVWFFRTL